MIQQIQTLYLLLAFVTTSILLFYSALDFEDGTGSISCKSVYTIILGLSTALTC
jgi:4-amino-4-deoxy-L-arabinose transferase-like glycosyltransferase